MPHFLLRPRGQLTLPTLPRHIRILHEVLPRRGGMIDDRHNFPARWFPLIRPPASVRPIEIPQIDDYVVSQRKSPSPIPSPTILRCFKAFLVHRRDVSYPPDQWPGQVRARPCRCDLTDGTNVNHMLVNDGWC